ncbi:hypothetical protein HETIRDRAFT_165893 [Heterobasidion irregulare TC 32-1]|uniref:Uncharacterized protein n=1 Tax=Heterobasidion irregulare (strain TC 32-1) TaxID=747525 RepID=W4KHT0_HETIT|nr:uncharacterized protein HETIRDRAFT_165893 [Heterobasidion irregulare TC 32-1]ETW84860.1 hypothetical protein HETIRDRAFT_165893 [Heterobasidion irregulare TC 32-1]
MWATGNRVKHKRRGDSSFSEENWGDSTLDYSSSIQQLEPPGWNRILARAAKYKQSRKGNAIIQAVEDGAYVPSVRAAIIDTIQDDDNSNSNSEGDASDDGVGSIGEVEDGMEEFDDEDEDGKIEANDVDEIVEDEWIDEDEV